MIILGEKYPLVDSRRVTLMEKLVKAKEKVDWGSMGELILSLGYLVELLSDACKAEDLIGFYRLARKMEETCEAIAEHIKIVTPEIAETAQRFRKT
jgi:hypothetical protein